MTAPITIKFTRPDGEARLEWCERCYPMPQDGGYVLLTLDDGRALHQYQTGRFIGLDLDEAVGKESAKAILLAAKKLRNEKRALAENEARNPYDLDVCQFSLPTLTGFTITWPVECSRIVGWGDGSFDEDSPVYLRAKSWHRTALLPILPDDCCYAPGKLPRRMTDDEVRFPDGSAGRMAMRNSHVRLGSVWKWRPGLDCSDESDHPANDPSQLARLQAFWDRAVKGPPVELAEDEFMMPQNGGEPKLRRMRIAFGGLQVRLGDDLWNSVDESELRRYAVKYPDPLGWPRALAYFDRHVAPGKKATVEGAKAILTAMAEPAPDLTELREALDEHDDSVSQGGSGHSWRVLGVARRLVDGSLVPAKGAR